jgi:hypothetical protein
MFSLFIALWRLTAVASGDLTLFDRISGKIEMESLWGRPSQLSAEDETELIETTKSRAEKGIGFGKKSFLKFVGVFADEKGIPFKTGSPSDMWWRRVKGRHTDLPRNSIKQS